MTPEQAAWVREFAWPASWQRSDLADVTRCPCQRGISADCVAGRHGRCVAGVPRVETYIRDVHGRITHLPELPRHPAMTALGPCHTRAAQVWLADRTCRWLCPCPHHNPAKSFAQDALFAIPTPTK